MSAPRAGMAVALAVLLTAATLLALTAAGTTAATPAAAYVHRTDDVRLPGAGCRTLADLTMPPRGWVLVNYQVPLIRAHPGSVLRVYLLRVYPNGVTDGTGGDARKVGAARWNVTNQHTLRGFRGRLLLRVCSTRPAVVPWLVAKAVRVAP